MGWHDDLAAKAVARGNTAADFKKGAQSNANATWICLIIAGVVWYFVDWRWALIPTAYAVWSAFKSVSASMVAARLEKNRAVEAAGEFPSPISHQRTLSMR